MPKWWKRFLIRTGIAQKLASTKAKLGDTSEFLHYFSDRVLDIPLDRLSENALFPNSDDPNTINLAQSVPRFNLTVTPFRSCLEGKELDPWGLKSLRASIRDIMEDSWKRSLPVDHEILVTSGASGAFSVVLDTLIDRGSRVILFDPTSPLFSIGLEHRGANITWIPTWMDQGVIRFEMALLAKAMRGTKLLVLADPNNPNGGIFSREDLEQIAFWADRYDVLVYLDRSFEEYRYSRANPIFDQIPKFKNRLLTVGSLSKSPGASSLRIGWISGNVHLLKGCMMTQLMNAPFLSPVLQYYGAEILADRTDNLTRRNPFQEKRDKVYNQLMQIGLNPIWPEAGCFFWIPIVDRGMSGKEFAKELARHAGVLVLAGEAFGPSGEYFIRVSYTPESARIREGIERIAKWLHSKNPAQPKALITQKPVQFSDIHCG